MSGSTAGPRTSAPRSARTSTRCWSSSPATATTFAQRRPPGPPGRRRVPHPGRRDEPAVPGRGARRPRLPGRPGHHELHRRAPAAAQRPPAGRPRHPDAHLPRRDHGEQAERTAARRSSSRSTSCPPAILHVPVAGRVPPAARRARARGVRGPAARAGRRRGHRHHVPRRAPVAARHPRAHPRPARRRPARRPAGPAAAVAWSAGAARPTTSRCGSSPRTRGSGSPRCARPCRTSARRCCCAGATPSATRRTRPR